MERKKNSVTIIGRNTKHAPTPAKNAVDYQAMYHGVDAVSRKPRVNDPRQCVDPKLKPVRQSLAYNVEGQIKGQRHYAEKDRYSCVAPSEYLIYTYGACVFLALMALYDGVLHNVLNKRIAHVRKRRISVQPRLILHLHDAVLKQLLFVLVKPQFVCKTVPALDKLRRAEAGGNAYAIRMVGNKMNNGVDAAVNSRILPQKSVTFGMTLPRAVAIA